jgi:hypothetical protein
VQEGKMDVRHVGPSIGKTQRVHTPGVCQRCASASRAPRRVEIIVVQARVLQRNEKKGKYQESNAILPVVCVANAMSHSVASSPRALLVEPGTTHRDTRTYPPVASRVVCNSLLLDMPTGPVLLRSLLEGLPTAVTSGATTSLPGECGMESFELPRVADERERGMWLWL